MHPKEQSTTNPVIIFGVGDMAKIAYHLFSENGRRVVGFAVDQSYLIDKYLSLPVYETSSIPKQYEGQSIDLFLGVGYKNMRKRAELFDVFKADGFRFQTLVCEEVYIGSDVKIGEGCIIMPGVVIEAGVDLGDNNIVWSNATICHDSTIGSHNFIAANATIGGFANIKNCSFFGFSSVVSDHVVCDDDVLLGALSFMQQNALACGCYVGTPAKLKRKHQNEGVMID